MALTNATSPCICLNTCVGQPTWGSDGFCDDGGDGATDSLFVTAGDKSDKSLHLWDMTSLTCLATLRGHKGEIRAVEFSRDGKYIFSAGMGGMLVWDLRNTDS